MTSPSQTRCGLYLFSIVQSDCADILLGIHYRLMVAFLETLYDLGKLQVDSFDFSNFEYLLLLPVEINGC